MNLYRFFILLSLACFGKAGPIVAVVAAAAGEAAGAAIAGSSVAAAFGVGASSIWYGSYVIVNGALFWGGGIAAGGALAAGVAGGAAGAVAAVTDKKKSAAVMASISAASAASEASVHSVAEASSKTQIAEDIHGAIDSLFKAPITASAKGAILQNIGDATAATAPTAPPIPPPPGQPVSTLPPGNRPSEVPAGVPDYNFRMCQHDIIKMGQNNQNLTFDNPSGYNLRVDNIPSTCMVLATMMLGDPALGPHPVPMGAASLQWNDVNPETINLIRQGFGQPPR